MIQLVMYVCQYHEPEKKCHYFLKITSACLNRINKLEYFAMFLRVLMDDVLFNPHFHTHC